MDSMATIKVEQAKGFSLWAIKAVLSGRVVNLSIWP
jgi:hypothetical protein